MFRVQFFGADEYGNLILLSEDELPEDDTRAALNAVVEATWPPRALVVRLLDAHGVEVFIRMRSDD